MKIIWLFPNPRDECGKLWRLLQSFRLCQVTRQLGLAEMGMNGVMADMMKMHGFTFRSPLQPGVQMMP